jgi:hypothetical protein
MKIKRQEWRGSRGRRGIVRSRGITGRMMKTSNKDICDCVPDELVVMM